MNALESFYEYFTGKGLRSHYSNLLMQQQHSSRSFLANSSNGVSGLGGGPNGSGGGGVSAGLVPTTTQPLNNNVFENGGGGGGPGGGGGGGGLLSKRFSSPSSSAGLGPLGYPGDLGGGLNPYEKWSNGSDKLFDQHTSDSILELSSKLLNLGKSSARLKPKFEDFSILLYSFQK